MFNSKMFLILSALNWSGVGITYASDHESFAGASARAVVERVEGAVVIEMGSPVASLSQRAGFEGSLSPVPELSEAPVSGSLRARFDVKTGLIVSGDGHARRSVSVVNPALMADPQWAMVDLMRQAQEFNVQQANELRAKQVEQAQDQVQESQRNWRLGLCNTGIAGAGAVAAGVALFLQYYS